MKFLKRQRGGKNGQEGRPVPLYRASWRTAASQTANKTVSNFLSIVCSVFSKVTFKIFYAPTIRIMVERAYCVTPFLPSIGLHPRQRCCSQFTFVFQALAICRLQFSDFQVGTSMPFGNISDYYKYFQINQCSNSL